jgi:hypothetical protein
MKHSCGAQDLLRREIWGCGCQREVGGPPKCSFLFFYHVTNDLWLLGVLTVVTTPQSYKPVPPLQKRLGRIIVYNIKLQVVFRKRLCDIFVCSKF